MLGDFAQRLDYEIVAFEAFDAAGAPIYHTNVLMCIGARFAAICSACIREDERAAVVDALRMTGHEIVDLSMEQLAAFAGNMLELRTPASGTVIAMSARAHDSLTAQQRRVLEARGGPIVASPIPTIETHGGGSVRCMLRPRRPRPAFCTSATHTWVVPGVLAACSATWRFVESTVSNTRIKWARLEQGALQPQSAAVHAAWTAQTLVEIILEAGDRADRILVDRNN